MSQKLTSDAKGRQAEWLAKFYFMAMGFRILAVRYKTPVGEIDMIVRSWVPWRPAIVAFVEVKRRATMAEASFAIPPRQQARIGQAAQWYLQRHHLPPKYVLRYDAFFMIKGLWPYHVPNAW